MKTILNKALHKGSILLFCLLGYVAHAANGTPAPNSANGDEPPADPLPIDGNITILALIALFFGIYIIYNYKQNKKRPI